MLSPDHAADPNDVFMVTQQPAAHGACGQQVPPRAALACFLFYLVN